MTKKLTPSLTDLEDARVKLKAAQDRSDNYSGNNPDKFRTQISDARVAVNDIEQQLKDDGILERSPHEKLELELDRRFPDAQSRQVVDFGGQKYQRKFTPVGTSLSGKTVKAWLPSWVALPAAVKS